MSQNSINVLDMLCREQLYDNPVHFLTNQNMSGPIRVVIISLDKSIRKTIATNHQIITPELHK